MIVTKELYNALVKKLGREPTDEEIENYPVEKQDTIPDKSTSKDSDKVK